jgi:hypothetical protein
MNAIDDTAWQEMKRYRDLAAEMGRDTDPLQLAVEAILQYREAIKQLRLERDHYRAQLYGGFGATG